MGDRRRRNVEWELPEQGIQWEHAKIAVLMDIREELQTLNRRLGCDNFLRLPYQVSLLRKATERIDKRIAEKVKLK